MSDHAIYQTMALPHDHEKSVSDRLQHIPEPPPWRVFSKRGQESRGTCFHAEDAVRQRISEVVNAALCLRRPILVEGGPGTGKTTLAYAIALELGLLGPYRWSITSRSTLRDGLYSYDAIGRLHVATLQKGKDGEDSTRTGQFLRLGPLGMAFYDSRPAEDGLPARPAVLLVDEIDKSDIDLPNDLLHVFEEGMFEIPELRQLEGEADEEVLPWRQSETGAKPVIHAGEVRCREFPLVIMTSNGEREFPGPFMRRCLRLKLDIPQGQDALLHLVKERFGTSLDEKMAEANNIIELYLADTTERKMRHSVDQLLNAMQLLLRGTDLSAEANEKLRAIVFSNLAD